MADGCAVSQPKRGEFGEGGREGGMENGRRGGARKKIDE